MENDKPKEIDPIPGADVDKQSVRALAASIHLRTNGLSAGGARQPVRWPARAQAPPAKPTTKNASSAKGTAVTTECTTDTLEHPGSTVRDRQHESAPGIVPVRGMMARWGQRIRGRRAPGTHHQRDQQPPPRDGPRRRNCDWFPGAGGRGRGGPARGAHPGKAQGELRPVPQAARRVEPQHPGRRRGDQEGHHQGRHEATELSLHLVRDG